MRWHLLAPVFLWSGTGFLPPWEHSNVGCPTPQHKLDGIGFQTQIFHCSPCNSPFQMLQLHFTHCSPFLLHSAAHGAAGGAQPRGSESISTTSFPARGQGWEEGLAGVIPRCLGCFSQSFNTLMNPLWRKEQVSFGWCSAGIPCVSSLGNSALF